MTARDMTAARQQTRDGVPEQTAALRQLTTQRVATELPKAELPKADRRTTRDGTVHTVAIEQAAVPVQATATATTLATTATTATTPTAATAATAAARPAADPVLELRGAAVRVGGRTLWSGVDLDVRAGEFVAVLGPNGVGKSTLLKVLLGVLPAAEGEARVLGLRPGQGGDRVGYLPQRRSFGPGMRIRGVDLVRLGLDGDRWGLPLPGGRRRREQAERIAEVVELVGAAAYAHRPIGECSGGEQQRLLIAQALVRRPAVLLLDEPLDSLDLPNQSAVAALIGRICHQEGVAVVMVAHDVNPILHHLDRVVYIAGGGAVAGTPGEVVTSENLTRLYGTPVEVLRTADGRLVVVGQPEA